MLQKWLRRIIGMEPWNPAWQKELSLALSDVQKGLRLNLVVVIARESDLYAELLFLLSFIGTSLGLILAVILDRWMTLSHEDLLLLPTMGFALGSSTFIFRRFYLTRFIPRAIRDRVTLKAKAMFFDYAQESHDHPVAMLYISEMEKEALFLASPQISEKLSSQKLRSSLSSLIIEYNPRNPMLSLRPCLEKIGLLLRPHFHSTTESKSISPVFVEASDRPKPEFVFVIKGNKDIN